MIWFARWSWTFRSVTNMKPLRIFQIMKNDHIKEKLIFRIQTTKPICHHGFGLSKSGLQLVNHRGNCYFLDHGLKNFSENTTFLILLETKVVDNVNFFGWSLTGSGPEIYFFDLLWPSVDIWVALIAGFSRFMTSVIETWI